MVTWLFLQGAESKYSDSDGRSYEYPTRIPNGTRVDAGDFFVVAVPKADAPDGRRVLGFGRIGRLDDKPGGLRDAVYDKYLAFEPPLTFDEIGGDPRPNPINSINRIDSAVIDTLLRHAGLASTEDLPSVAIDGHNGVVPPNSEHLRDELHAAVIADLLGPAEGPEEEVVESSVRSRYLLGQLAPMDLVLEPGEQDDVPKGASTVSDDGEAEEDRLQSESLVPSSIGFTFAVTSEIDQIRVEARWGHYMRVRSEEGLLTDSGQARMVWKRHPAGGAVTVDLSKPDIRTTPDTEQPEVWLRGSVRTLDDGDRLVTLFLVNEQAQPDTNKDSAWLFQPEIHAAAIAGDAVFRARPDLAPTSGAFGGPEQRAMKMLHRERVEFAVGHGVGVHADVATDDPARATRVSTAVVPEYDVPVTEPPDGSDDGFEELGGLELSMKWLAEASRAEVVSDLEVLTDAYAAWQVRQQQRVDDGELNDHQQAAEEALQGANRALDRLRAGIDVLRDDSSPAFEAFQFANRAMWQQRVRSEYVARRRRGDEITVEELDVPANRSWRPFQLAFVLLSLPGIADPEHPERTSGAQAVADLLWFPTGGGKTEAYLGVAAYTMALRRLQGDLGGYEAARGVAVIMRYTLRLLTIQQFQRASALLCAMEVARREDLASGDDRWGGEPFRLGLWVGNKATPGRTADAHDSITEAKGDTWHGGRGSGTPAQITTCPWSGHQIEPGRDIEVRKFRGDIGRTITYCSDPMGQCPFSRARAKNEGIPVLVVDQEIYQRLPAMVIATVDKFAQMPWRGETQMLFGRVSGYCPRHGFLSPDIETDTRPELRCTGQHQKKGQLPYTQKQATGPLRPPDLIIQDELHLISGPLGTIVGLYEAAVDELCTWNLGDKRIHPKVIASTATIRKAREQIHNLFLRAVEVFPPHGLDIEDNFFALQRPTEPGADKRQPGRRYLGICAPGKSRPATLIRVYVALLTAAQKLYEEHGEAADPWMTLVGYFNSLRELGGMRRLVEDDVSTRAFRMNQPNTDLQRPGLAQRKRVVVEELTSRRSSTDIPRILDRLEGGFDPDAERQSAIDVLLATNMVSVGVDVQRLGLMAVAGQPKTTAEYIQATSRVGRRHPGLVVTVLNWARPRDFSHYETFEHYHATFYEHVEALTLTPFAPRAIDRALTGVFTSLARLDEAELDPNDGARELKPTHPVVKNAVARLVDRAFSVTDRTDIRDLVKAELDELVHEWTHEVTKPDVVYGYKGRKDGQTVGLLKQPSSDPWTEFTVLTSMRDVEPTAGLVLSDKFSGTGPDWTAKDAPDDGDGAE